MMTLIKPINHEHQCETLFITLLAATLTSKTNKRRLRVPLGNERKEYMPETQHTLRTATRTAQNQDIEGTLV